MSKKTETAEAEVAQDAPVRMWRDPAVSPKPHTADVHPAEVESWQSAGWQIGEGPTPAVANEMVENLGTPGNIVPTAQMVRVPDQPTSSTTEGLQRPYEAVHRGNNSYSVMDGEEELVQGLTRAEAKTFNALPYNDKVAFISVRVEKEVAMTLDDVIEKLTAAGIEHDPALSLDELSALLNAKAAEADAAVVAVPAAG